MEEGYFARRSTSAERPLPSPSDTPYATPSARLSSFGSQQVSTPLTPPPLPPPRFDYDDKNSIHEDAQDGFDAASLTSTLHASLVQQILSLRRELESKSSFIEDLESSLASSRNETDTLQTSLKRTGKETRALKRELQLHEDGTLSAMEVLAKERDESNDANSELRRRVEASQKRMRSQEEENLRYKSALEHERLTWSTEKRHLERRAKLAEQRLTEVVDEVAAREAESLESSRLEGFTSAGAQEDHKSETASIHTVNSPEVQLRSRRSIGSVHDVKRSLADELDLSDAEEGSESKPTSKQTSPLSTRAALSSATSSPVADRTASRSSLHAAAIALSGISKQDSGPAQEGVQAREIRPTSNDDGRASKVLGLVSSFENQMRSVVQEQERTTSLVARSQSSKNKLQRKVGFDTEDSDAEEPTPEQVEMAREVREKFSDIEAKRVQDGPLQRRRASHARTQSDPLPKFQFASLHFTPKPLSPPESSESSAAGEDVETGEKAQPRVLVPAASVGTQTDPASVATVPAPSVDAVTATTSMLPPPEPSRPPPPPPPPPSREPPPVPGAASHVPAIAIHAPDNASLVVKRPTTGLRNVGTQTHFKRRFPTKSTGMQTEKIRVDTRTFIHSLPADKLEQARHSMEQRLSATEPITSPIEVVPVPESVANEPVNHEATPVHSPLPPLEELEDDSSVPADIETNRKSLYSSPPFVATDDKELDLEELDEFNLSDIEYGSALNNKAVPKSQRYSGRAVDLPAPVPEHGRISTAALYNRSRLSMSNRGSARSSMDKGRRQVASLNVEALSQYQARLPQVNRSTVAESRSPSISSGFSSAYSNSKTSGPRPPFAIPSRKSSKEQYAKIRYIRPNAHISPTRKTNRAPSPTKVTRGDSHKLVKKQPPQALRKAHSVAAIEDTVRVSDTLGEPAALGYTKLPRVGKQITSPPNNIEYEQKRDEKNSPTQIAHIGTMFPTGSATAFSSMQHSVVDAITATTIGEWMFKYVRKRKSFASSEADGNNERHKRWVWLSPYDRTIMWSTKQPATNSALMGKAGRKLSIQSVLDVKDDTPAPKEVRAPGIYNRSILVLTPARALKFTAVSRERHYLWLTALSFLAHHSDKNVAKYSFQAPDPSLGDSIPSSGRSRASSFRNPLRPNRGKPASDKSSGRDVSVALQVEAANVQRTASKAANITDTAFAPSIPRVPHSRKRSTTGPSRGRTAGSLLSGLSSGHASTTKLTTSNSSARVQSVGGASARRALQQQEGDAASLEQRGRGSTRYSQQSRLESSPPRSLGNAEFGGNSSFFDAVGVMKLDALVKSTAKPGAGAGAENGKGKAAGASAAGESAPGHRRNQSSEAFIGPPDISRSRTLKKTANGRGGQTSFFGF